MGALFSGLLAAKFPSARFTRICYYAMILSGVCGVVFAAEHIFAFGVLTILVLLAAGIFGVIGSVRKELRSIV